MPGPAAIPHELVTGLLLRVLCASAASLCVPRHGPGHLAKRSAVRAIAKTAGSRS